ncbi:hypothetical protein KKF11_00935 [Patescibacteria group bacterium]|nr:hypothetical protein [Patescibacteria group bacterium]
MQNRLVRLLLAGLAGAVVIFGFKALSGGGAKSILKPVGEKIEDIGESILGAAVKVLPNPPVFEDVKDETSDGKVLNADDKEDTEPIEEPVKNIEKQTEVIIEQIKNLPKDQVDAIKKQIYKEMCEVLEGEE